MEKVPSQNLTFARLFKLGFLALAFYFLAIGLESACQIVLLFLAGCVGAVVLNGLAAILTRRGLSYRISLGIVLLVALAGVAVLGMSVGTALAEQGQQLSENLPSFFQKAKSTASKLPFGDRMIDELSDSEFLKNTSSRLLGWSSTLLGALSSLLLLLVITLYLAVDPHLYWDGVAKLFSPRRRPKVQEIGRLARKKVWAFVKGQAFSMTLLAILTSVGLWFLGVPLYLLLGCITGLLVMIPYLGPILSVGPAALVAAGQGGNTVLWVLALYAGLQFLESYILTPLVQEEAAALPPVLTLFAQAVMGLFFGIIGVLMAAPITAVALLLVEELWVKPLEEGHTLEPPGQQTPQSA